MGSFQRNMKLLVTLSTVFGSSLAWVTATQAQQADSGAYQGVSRPPADPIVTTQDAPQPVILKPNAGVVAQPNPQPAQVDSRYASNPNATSGGYSAPGATNSAVAEAMPSIGSQPAVSDPDGDVVHPRPRRAGELMEGSTIRVRLLDRLSSSYVEKGQHFRGQVASDVLQDGRVLIPAGSGIEGRVTNVSTGHFGSHGSFRLKPEEVVLPDGTRYVLHAYTSGTPGSTTRVGSEGTINPGSRAKKDGIEYGAVVGTGAITGAVLGGPVGALTGSLIGAGMVTTHIMVDHPQATLEPGAVLLFTLTEPMNLIPPTQPGN